MKILINISLFFLYLLITGCHKTEEKYYVQGSFKEWALFQYGSYWIYLNEKSNRVDSSWVYDGPSTWFYKPSGDGKLYEVISFQILNIGEFRLGARTDYSTLLIEGKFLSGGYALTSLVTSKSSEHVSQTCWVMKRYDSLLVNNQLFFDVIQTRDTFSNSVNDFYFAKKVGLIKFAIKNEYGDSTWSLVRSHIEQ